MGCVHGKGVKGDDIDESRQRKGSANSLRRLVSSSSRKSEVVVVDAEGSVEKDGSLRRLVSKLEDIENSRPEFRLSERENIGTSLPEIASTPPPFVDDRDKRVGHAVERQNKVVVPINKPVVETEVNLTERKSIGVGSAKEPGLVIRDVPNASRAEHVAAGWPSWLTNVAGDAVRGWLPRRADSFEKLNKIGQGTYSSVYKARDLETRKMVALKKVRFVNMDPESVRFMAREIHILRRLDHPNVVKLEALVASRASSSVYLVFEYMEHDLAGLSATPGIKFTEPQIKCYMQQLLCGLDHCHSHGVLHRDIKGANLLIDNNGILKIADFGLATFYNPDYKQPLTSRVVTLWYRPPELLLGATDYGVGVDMWSTGCILAELLCGKPIMPGRTEVEQMHRIFKLCGSPSEEYWRTSKLPHATSFKPIQRYPRRISETFRNFPASALVLLDQLLAIEPAERGTASSALDSEFFTTKPFACDPSSLPKYPPSKEYDSKLRDEEVRRQREAAVKGHEFDYAMRKPIVVPGGYAELQKQHPPGNTRISGISYASKEELAAHAINVHKRMVEKGSSHSGPLTHPRRPSHLGLQNGHGLNPQKSSMAPSRTIDMPSIPDPTVARSNTVRLEHRRSDKHLLLPERHSGYPVDANSAPDKQEWSHHLLHGTVASHKKDDRTSEKEPTTVYGSNKSRVHYSGPLMPPGGNIEEILKEHERQIQEAVRRARHDRIKAKNYNDKGLEALLYPSRNGRPDH